MMNENRTDEVPGNWTVGRSEPRSAMKGHTGGLGRLGWRIGKRSDRKRERRAIEAELREALRQERDGEYVWGDPDEEGFGLF